MTEIAAKTLLTLEIGDEVAINDSRGQLHIATVKKAAKTQFTAMGVRFTRAQGLEVGAYKLPFELQFASARPATPRLLGAAATQQRLRSAKTAFRGLLEALEQQKSGPTLRLEAAIPHLQAALEAMKAENKEKEPDTPKAVA